MDGQSRFHRCGQPFDRHVVVGLKTVSRSVAGVNGLVGIEKQHAKCQIVIELKQPQIETITLDQPDVNELVREFPNLIFSTNNLLVKSFAGISWDAAENDH